MARVLIEFDTPGLENYLPTFPATSLTSLELKFNVAYNPTTTTTTNLYYESNFYFITNY